MTKQTITTQIPKFSIGQSVILRVIPDDQNLEKFDIPTTVLDVIQSQQHGISYELSLPKGYFKSNIKPEKDIRAGLEGGKKK